jgi:hypothetical protein
LYRYFDRAELDDVLSYRTTRVIGTRATPDNPLFSLVSLGSVECGCRLSIID